MISLCRCHRFDILKQQKKNKHRTIQSIQKERKRNNYQKHSVPIWGEGWSDFVNVFLKLPVPRPGDLPTHRGVPKVDVNRGQQVRIALTFAAHYNQKGQDKGGGTAGCIKGETD
ncbi:hypothetical protein Trydic_g10727 [Trypoxylus dichotomus]